MDIFFECDSSKSMKEFREMIRCEHLEKSIFQERKIMENLELKGIEKCQQLGSTDSRHLRSSGYRKRGVTLSRQAK